MPLDTTPGKGTRSFRQVGSRPVRPDGVDKVTGRARFGADMTAPGMLIGKVLRSPHAHAKIRRIDTRKAAALPGVKAIVTAADFAKLDRDHDLYWVLNNVMARGKALYDGHAVAAVAAASESIAKQALKLIEVDYDVLPHVIDVDEAMKPNAPLVHDDLITDGVEPKPKKPSNIGNRYEYKLGDVAKGFAEAEVVIEREFKTEAAHQCYIEPQACLASYGADGQGEMWVCTQGHYMIREYCTTMLGMEVSKLRVTASEIGGGFGGKTTVFIEPVALALSKKSGRPVKMVMTREEVFRASGPTASSSSRVKIGVKKDGTITAGEAVFKYQGGAFPGFTRVQLGAMTAFACYDLKNVSAVGYDVVCNRPHSAAYRAPGAPMSAFAVESVIEELAHKIEMDPIELRLKNAAKEGTKSAYGPTFKQIGMIETLKAAKAHPHYGTPLGPNQGRGVASGFWFNFGGQSCVSLNVNADGTVALALGTPDIGGSRASMCLIAAEELGIPYDQVRAVVTDTSSLGYNETTDGSRVTFATGLATIKAAQDAIKKMCGRAAKTWGIPEDAVAWESGQAKPAGANAGKFPPLTIKELAANAGKTGGPIAGHYEMNADGAGVSFSTHIADVEVDPETGRSSVVRYTVVQDAGKAIHPSYVEGQFQGGAAQGIGWALTEEYIYGKDGKLQNPGFLDYRTPVASDVPMINTVIVEVPNPGHPYGVRGVGETSIVPPLAAVANAVSQAAGVRMTHVPISPPRLLAAIQGNGSSRKA